MNKVLVTGKSELPCCPNVHERASFEYFPTDFTSFSIENTIHVFPSPKLVLIWPVKSTMTKL